MGGGRHRLSPKECRDNFGCVPPFAVVVVLLSLAVPVVLVVLVAPFVFAALVVCAAGALSKATRKQVENVKQPKQKNKN